MGHDHHLGLDELRKTDELVVLYRKEAQRIRDQKARQQWRGSLVLVGWFRAYQASLERGMAPLASAGRADRVARRYARRFLPELAPEEILTITKRG